MTIVIALDYESKHPHTLIVMKDEMEAVQAAAKFSEYSGIQLSDDCLRAERRLDGRFERWSWDWPRMVEGIWKQPGPWVWLYAGHEISRIELNTPLKGEDLTYLINRMRGQHLENSK